MSYPCISPLKYLYTMRVDELFLRCRHRCYGGFQHSFLTLAISFVLHCIQLILSHTEYFVKVELVGNHTGLTMPIEMMSFGVVKYNTTCRPITPITNVLDYGGFAFIHLHGAVVCVSHLLHNNVVANTNWHLKGLD